MKDLVERLIKQDCKTWLDAYDIMEEAADEIERLEKENQQLLNDCNAWAQEVKTEQRLSFRDQVAKLEKELAESQAREAKLREAIKQINTGHIGEKEYMEALALPTDDTALKEYKRKVLLDAADQFDIEANVMHIDGMVTVTASNLRRMAEEVLK